MTLLSVKGYVCCQSIRNKTAHRSYMNHKVLGPSDDNEISTPLYHPMFHCRIHNDPPLGPLFRAVYPVHTVTSYYLVLASRLALSNSLSSELFYSAPHMKNLNLLTNPMRATCLEFITVITFGEQQRRRGFSICNFLQPLVTVDLALVLLHFALTPLVSIHFLIYAL
jgi:hypothetical protein